MTTSRFIHIRLHFAGDEASGGGERGQQRAGAARDPYRRGVQMKDSSATIAILVPTAVALSIGRTARNTAIPCIRKHAAEIIINHISSMTIKHTYYVYVIKIERR
ncbi:hypothetical protein HW555_012721 [Spodoptera exigua]|uniref:Uncharacterized protein n=1 Tax=Spodoptera exigua TaxID=7107 RepID=A0A835G2Z3_SPOEX|nr:hypothetical protein HW555_012721 [Spodoptera exigua]